jgi:uncharacterized protein YxjI
MELFVIPKGSKFLVQDKKERELYTVKKKAFGNKYLLLDASGYALYSITQIKEGKKPEFQVDLNEEIFMTIKCLSLFLDPSIECIGKDMTFLLKSTDRRNFIMTKNGNEMGKLTTVTLMTGDLQYELQIDDKEFDDYFPLFAVAIDKAFGDINRSK